MRRTELNRPLLLLAHGTREPEGPRVIERLAAATAQRLDVPVHVGYVDVIGPTVAEALSTMDGPIVALPAFLAAGYHVRTDLPEQIAATQRGDVVITEPLGPAPEITTALLDRLTEAGWRPGRPVRFAAAGSSDERALTDVRTAADQLGRRCRQWLTPTYVTTASPATGEACRPTDFIAPYLLAPGLFHQWLADIPAAGIADPIGVHPSIVDLVTRRYRATQTENASAA